MLKNANLRQFTALEVIRIEDFIERHVSVGRPPEDKLPIARAFIAKAVYGHTTTRQLLNQIQSDVRLRRICGWEKAQDVPRKWTFSRVLAEFFESELPTKVHEALIVKFQNDERRFDPHEAQKTLKKRSFDEKGFEHLEKHIPR